MGFYKPGANHPLEPKTARLHKIIWALIFGGLLTLILGIFVERLDDSFGWTMVVTGGVLTAIGAVLIYVRSTMTTESK
jgi:xanthine/uracil permease